MLEVELAAWRQAAGIEVKSPIRLGRPPLPWIKRACVVCRVGFKFKYEADTRKCCSVKCKNELRAQQNRASSLLPYDFVLLYDLYWNQGLSLNQIGKVYGLNSNAAADTRTRFQRLGIPTRSKGAHLPTTHCILDGCNEPVYRLNWKHVRDGYSGSRRCMEHHVAHRKKVAAEYWTNRGKWRKLGLGTDASAESLSTRIENVVPKTLPYEIRDEVVQELALKIMMREVSIEELETSAVKKHISHFYREYQDKWGDLSLDAPMTEDGLTLGDMLEG